MGSAFTVGVTEERDTAPNCEITAALEHAHKMAATTTPCSVIAATHKSSQVTADVKESSQVTADVKEPSQVTADVKEPSQVTADVKEPSLPSHGLSHSYISLIGLHFPSVTAPTQLFTIITLAPDFHLTITITQSHPHTHTT